MNYAGDVARAVRPYQPADKTALREFQGQYFGAASRQCNDAFGTWLFERNPHRRAEQPYLWVCMRGGRVVGQQASIPVRVHTARGEVHAAWGIDLMVAKEWRLKGVAPALSSAYQRSADAALGIGISEAVHRSYVRAGWTDMGEIPVFVRPLDATACMEAVPRARLVAKLAPRILVRSSTRMFRGIAAALARMELEHVTAFDERVDAVWQSSSRTYSVLVRRDFDYLRWRYDQMPGNPPYERHYLTRQGQVIGYVVSRYGLWRGHSAAWIVDYLAEPRWLGALFALAIDSLNSRNAVAVFIEQLNVRVGGTLRALGCFPAMTSTRFIAACGGSTGALCDAGNWFLTRGDSDGDHDDVAGVSMAAATTGRASARVTLPA